MNGGGGWRWRWVVVVVEIQDDGIESDRLVSWVVEWDAEVRNFRLDECQ